MRGIPGDSPPRAVTARGFPAISAHFTRARADFCRFGGLTWKLITTSLEHCFVTFSPCKCFIEQF